MSERREYKRYSKEFKLEAIRQMQTSNKPMTQLARELDVRVNQL
jgi:transposase-like protein